MIIVALAAFAQAVPDRQVPPAVLAEVQQLQNRFELALSADCDSARCFSKGCVYVDHAVADRPRAASLPGLAESAGPSAADAQEYLTRARCSFAHEQALEAADVQMLVRRLETRLSSGWTSVAVERQALPPLAEYLRNPPEPAVAEVEPVEEVAPPAAPEAWTMAAAGRELWDTLLPHSFWMVGLGLATLAVTTLIWAFRRVGRASIEEQALLAEATRPEPATTVEPEGADASEAERAWVAEQEAAWRARFEAMDPARPDPEIQALIRALLRSGDTALLAKAVLRFPKHLPAAFPSGGDLATAKLELAEALENLAESSLPSDVVFYESLNRRALAASVASQADARVVRSLREDFGAAGLAALIGRLPGRVAALLFALAPPTQQHEVVRLLSSGRAADLVEELLRSDRMDPRESAWLFEVVQAAASGAPPPLAPPLDGVSDHGTAFDAAGALSVLLPAVGPSERALLFHDALRSFGGEPPAWYRGILVPDMLLALGAEPRADVLLEVDAEPLAAWFSLMDADVRGELSRDLPGALRAAVGVPPVATSARLLALAARGRQAVARGFWRQATRSGLSFAEAVRAAATGAA